MYRYLLIGIAAAAALAAAPMGGEPAVPAPGSTVQAEGQGAPFRWTGRIPAGQSIEVKGVSGTIRAEASAGGEVEVVATRTAERSDPESVRIEVLRHEGGVTICAVYPRGTRLRSAQDDSYNRCEAGGWNHLNVEDNDVRVDFTVRVPAGVRLVARNVSGDVYAEGLRSNVEANSVSGDVRLSTTGYGEAGTVSGDIFASLGSAAWRGELEFNTVSGDVTLELPARTSTDVRVETMSGRISSDFPLEIQDRRFRQRVRGTIGDGGRGLSVTTLSGDIRLRRGR